MKITTKGRYALRIFVDLAEHNDGGFVALKDIANRQGISKKYLEQIISSLNRPNILQVNRGTQGGYKLSREPSSYTVAEILELTDGTFTTPANNDSDDKKDGQEDYTAFIWEELRETVTKFLESITIQDIVDRKNSLVGNDYVI